MLLLLWTWRHHLGQLVAVGYFALLLADELELLLLLLLLLLALQLGGRDAGGRGPLRGAQMGASG